jgi:hypothetical protein
MIEIYKCNIKYIVSTVRNNPAHNETVSAYHQICGVFDFNSHPLVHVGTNVLVYESATCFMGDTAGYKE